MIATKKHRNLYRSRNPSTLHVLISKNDVLQLYVEHRHYSSSIAYFINVYHLSYLTCPHKPEPDCVMSPARKLFHIIHIQEHRGIPRKLLHNEVSTAKYTDPIFIIIDIATCFRRLPKE